MAVGQLGGGNRCPWFCLPLFAQQEAIGTLDIVTFSPQGDSAFQGHRILPELGTTYALKPVISVRNYKCGTWGPFGKSGNQARREEKQSLPLWFSCHSRRCAGDVHSRKAEPAKSVGIKPGAAQRQKDGVRWTFSWLHTGSEWSSLGGFPVTLWP